MANLEKMALEKLQALFEDKYYALKRKLSDDQFKDVKTLLLMEHELAKREGQ